MTSGENKNRKSRVSHFVKHAGDGQEFPLHQSFTCARCGLKYAFLSQRNYKIHAVVALLAIILGFVLQISAVEWCAIVICIFAVFALETMNTAIESVVDLVSSEWNELAKHAKDCSAAAVYITAIGSVVIAIVIFLPKILTLCGISV